MVVVEETQHVKEREDWRKNMQNREDPCGFLQKSSSLLKGQLELISSFWAAFG